MNLAAHPQMEIYFSLNNQAITFDRGHSPFKHKRSFGCLWFLYKDALFLERRAFCNLCIFYGSWGLDGLKAATRWKSFGSCYLKTTQLIGCITGVSFLGQRRSYLTSSSSRLRRLENMKLDLKSILTPVLLKSVKDFKRNTATIWVLDDKFGFKAVALRQGVDMYIRLSTFITSVASSLKFCRYFATHIKNIASVICVPIEVGDGVIYSSGNGDDTLCKAITRLWREFQGLGSFSVFSGNFRLSKRGGVRPTNVDWALVRNPFNWAEILKSSAGDMNCIIFKVWAVEQVFKAADSCISGVDGQSFLAIVQKTASVNITKKYLERKVQRLIRVISLSKGSTDQSIQRKGIMNLSSRERFRRYLKTRLGKNFVLQCRRVLVRIRRDPAGYWERCRSNAVVRNNWLKFQTCFSLKHTSLLNYRSSPVLKLFTSDSGNCRVSEIFTIRDRAVQFLLKSVMEPYLEPLGDEASFGFRPGRDSHQATSYLNVRLNCFQSFRRMLFASDLFYEKSWKFFWENTCRFRRIYLTSKLFTGVCKPALLRIGTSVRDKQILILGRLHRKVRRLLEQGFAKTHQRLSSVNISNCFDTISHLWLMKNLPIPVGYSFLLARVLKFETWSVRCGSAAHQQYNFLGQGSLLKFVCRSRGTARGFLKSGIISPLLVNWALDGLLCFVKSKAHAWAGSSTFCRRNIFMDRKRTGSSLIPHKSDFQVWCYNTSWVVRYAGAFIVGVKSEICFKAIHPLILSFLNVRGFSLPPHKVITVPWRLGSSVSFLQWTHSLFFVKKNSRKYRFSKKPNVGFLGRIKVYTYPSRAATFQLREAVRLLTSSRSAFKSVSYVVRELNSVITEWSLYFTPGPHQSVLRRGLDVFIWRRFRKFLINKYKHSYYTYFMKFCAVRIKPLVLYSRKKFRVFYDCVNKVYMRWRRVPVVVEETACKRKSFTRVESFVDLSVNLTWAVLVPSNAFLRSSFFTNPELAVNRILRIQLFGVLKKRFFRPVSL